MRFGWLLFVCVWAAASPAYAQILEAPIGGKSIPIGDGRVACAASAGSWSVEPGGHLLKPPVNQDAVGQSVELKIAPSSADCPSSTASLTLVATARWPSFDPASVVFAVDDGRLDVKGRRLSGVTLNWKSESISGSDVCHDPKTEGGFERCAWTVAHEASADPNVTRFVWLPAGARASADAVFFDADAHQMAADAFHLVPARVTIRQLLSPDAAVDLATGQGEVPLVHPAAVSSADCGALHCEMSNGKLVVRGASRLVSWLEIKLRLRPHVVLLKNDVADTQLTARIAVLHCPMSITSGPPIRNNDDAKIVVKLEGGCAQDVSSLRFVTDHNPLKILQTTKDDGVSYVVLQLGNVADDNVAITAFRGQTEEIAIAVARAATRSAPAVRASLELPGFPNLGFIPNNRSVVVHVSPAGEQQHFALLPIEGVYSVGHEGDQTTLRGDPNAAGMTGLSFGVRANNLPEGLDETDLAVVSDPLQRSIREANIPAPIGALVASKTPLIEMLCGGGPVPVERVEVGVTAHLAFSLRDTCRIVFHRERLSADYGTQELRFEIDVMRPDGSARGDAHVAEVVTLREGKEPRYAWIHGVVDPFDRVVVRVSHEPDEAHYMGASEIKTGAAAAKWSAVLGTGHVRLYGTSTIPTGLYRLSGSKANNGILSLNFGVISRLTWLDSDGQEGFIGAEGGILVMGLASPFVQTGPGSSNMPSTRIGAVVGLGISVPIANRAAPTQASIALHAWLETDLSRSSAPAGGYTAFVFGPSITIGNVGTNL